MIKLNYKKLTILTEIMLQIDKIEVVANKSRKNYVMIVLWHQQ